MNLVIKISFVICFPLLVEIIPFMLKPAFSKIIGKTHVFNAEAKNNLAYILRWRDSVQASLACLLILTSSALTGYISGGIKFDIAFAFVMWSLILFGIVYAVGFSIHPVDLETLRGKGWKRWWIYLLVFRIIVYVLNALLLFVF
jgi:hypothetical protein